MQRADGPWGPGRVPLYLLICVSPQKLVQPLQHDRMKIDLTTIITYLGWHVRHHNELPFVPMGIGAVLLKQVSNVAIRAQLVGHF